MITVSKKLPEGLVVPIIADTRYLLSISGIVDYGYFIDGKKILPFVIRKKMFLKWMQIDCAPIGCSSKNDSQQFVDSIVEYVKKGSSVSCISSTNTALFPCVPTDSFYCLFGTYLVDLDKDEALLFSSLHSKHRNSIRKAQSNSVVVEHGEHCARDVIELMNNTYGRQNKISAIGENYISRMKNLGNNVDFWLARSCDGTPQGSAIFLWSKGHTCYYLHGGSSSHTVSGSMNLLIWEAMLEMKKRGVRYFDFVGARLKPEPGSKQEGIQRFKSRFGADLKTGYMFRVVIDPIMYHLFTFCINVYHLIKEHKFANDVISEERLKGNY